jgi:hypothetical protein
MHVIEVGPPVGRDAQAYNCVATPQKQMVSSGLLGVQLLTSGSIEVEGEQWSVRGKAFERHFPLVFGHDLGPNSSTVRHPGPE